MLVRWLWWVLRFSSSLRSYLYAAVGRHRVLEALPLNKFGLNWPFFVKLVTNIMPVEVTPSLRFLLSVISTSRAWDRLEWDTAYFMSLEIVAWWRSECKTTTWRPLLIYFWFWFDVGNWSRKVRWLRHVARKGDEKYLRNCDRKPWKGRDHSEDAGVDVRTLLKWILEE